MSDASHSGDAGMKLRIQRGLGAARSVKGGRWLLAALGIIAVLLGGLLIERSGSSTAGSPVGWVLVALGIIAVLVAFGIAVGAYGD
jgi:hypothetical protein